MVWTFSFSLWIVNGAYISNYNASLYEDIEPEVIEMDNCGPANLISAGFALWLVLVPAVACVVQLPGSLILYRRSNFYRFSPELGLVETLAVLSLLAKALWKGYRWDESIAAVFAVRDGIGQGDLWWREDLEAMFPANEVEEDPDTVHDQDQESGVIRTNQDHDSASEETENAEVAETSTTAEDEETSTTTENAGNDEGTGVAEMVNDSDDVEEAEDSESSESVVQSIDADNDSDAPDDRVRDFLDSKLAPRLEPLSQERVLGAGLFLVAFIKIVAMVQASTNSGVRLSCYLALAYSTSYLVLEILTWSYVFPLRNNSLRNVPPENLLDVMKFVDPGNNPFTFPSDLDDPITDSIPLSTITSASTSQAAPPSLQSRVFSPYPESTKYPWNRSIAIITATLGFLGPLTWLVVLSNIFSPALGVVVLSCFAIAFLFLRIGGKWLYHILRQTIVKPSQSSTTRSRTSVSSPTNATTSTTDPEAASTTTIPLPPRDPFVQHNKHGLIHFFAVWFWRRITAVNLYSAIWVAVICYYFARIFPVKANLGGDAPEDMIPQKPNWLKWLG